jgi:hypothetical protein
MADSFGQRISGPETRCRSGVNSNSRYRLRNFQTTALSHGFETN